MNRYLSITLAVVVVVLILPLTMKSCSLTVPTPPTPNQTASQKASCFGLIVSHSCNQAIYQGQPQPTNWAGMLDSATALIVVLAVLAVLAYAGLSIAFRRQEG
jgi:hypothetical protein